MTISLIFAKLIPRISSSPILTKFELVKKYPYYGVAPSRFRNTHLKPHRPASLFSFSNLRQLGNCLWVDSIFPVSSLGIVENGDEPVVVPVAGASFVEGQLDFIEGFGERCDHRDP